MPMAFKKKILSFLTSAACLVSGICAYSSINASDNEAVAASVTGQSAFEITSQMKIGWNLGNSLDATNPNLTIEAPPKKFATSWGNPEPTQKLIAAVKAGGFNTIRIPVSWSEHLYLENGEYKVDDAWMDYVKKYVDIAYNMNMYVILNTHHEDYESVASFSNEQLNTSSAKLKGVWKRVSEVFKDYDQKLVFEGINEIRSPGSSTGEWGDGDQSDWDYVNKLNAVFVEEVRAQGSNNNNERLLMLPGYHAGNSVSTIEAIEVKPEYGNVALSVHAYNPYFFCMDESEYSNHEYPGKSGYGSDYTEELRSMFNSYKQIISNKNCPIIMGEFSASDFNNTQSRVNWAKDYLGFAKDAGIPCVLWDNNVIADGVKDNGEAHGYINRSNNTWYPNSLPVVAAMMDTVGVTGYDLPEYTPPVFSWDTVGIKDDWVKLYYNQSGKDLDAWIPDAVSGYEQYLNENYVFAMVQDSSTKPVLVVQTSTGEGGWNFVLSDNENNSDFVLYYTYQDIVDSVTGAGDSMSAMNGFYVSAHSGAAKIYGLYAVPADSLVTPTEPTTEDTEPTTTTTKPLPPGSYIPGDVNYDNVVNVFDSVKLRSYLIKISDPNVDYALPASDYLRPFDTNGNGNVEVADLVLLNQYLVGKVTELQYSPIPLH